MLRIAWDIDKLVDHISCCRLLLLLLFFLFLCMLLFFPLLIHMGNIGICIISRVQPDSFQLILFMPAMLIVHAVFRDIDLCRGSQSQQKSKTCWLHFHAYFSVDQNGKCVKQFKWSILILTWSEISQSRELTDV